MTEKTRKKTDLDKGKIRRHGLNQEKMKETQDLDQEKKASFKILLFSIIPPLLSSQFCIKIVVILSCLLTDP